MKKFFYRAEKDETLLSVAKKFRVPPMKIVIANNLKRELQAGDLLYIEREEGRLYTVKPEDTASGLSARFDIPEEKILSDNGVPYLFYGLTIMLK